MGSEASYKTAAEVMANSQVSLSDHADGFNPADYGLLSIHEGVGVVNIVGSLVTNAHPGYAMYGVVGYNAIKDTLTVAAQDPEIKHILLNIDSPGGSAAGVDSVSTLISKISSEYKPVTAFSEGQMASAAYWIGASADSISTTRLADVGSIGVIAISQEYTKAMEQSGVTPTVFRAGEFKALGSPYEVMSKDAAKVIQGKLDTLYSEFTSHIAASRGQLPADTTKWAEGKTFMGFQGLKVGLVDQITTFEDLTTSLVKKVSGAKDSGRMKLSAEGEPDMARKQLLGEKEVAILAAGGELPVQMGVLDTVEDVAKVVEKVAETIVDVIEDIKKPEPPESVVDKSGMVDYFKAELSAAHEKVLTLSMDNREMKTKLEQIDVTHTQLRAIATDAVNLRNVGLGRGRIELSTASDEVILSTYNTVSKEFNNTFHVGGITEVASTERPKSLVNAAAMRAAKI